MLKTILRLPYPKAEPLFGETFGGLANRMEVHWFVVEFKEQTEKLREVARAHYATTVFFPESAQHSWITLTPPLFKQRQKKKRTRLKNKTLWKR